MFIEESLIRVLRVIFQLLSTGMEQVKTLGRKKTKQNITNKPTFDAFVFLKLGQKCQIMTKDVKYLLWVDVFL